MLTTLESQLWLAVHLLYPSSNQAFDVYQAIVQQSENALKKNQSEVIFLKLVQVFDKIPAVSASLSFQEFEFHQIDQWKNLYKSSQKNQLSIFVGVLIFELKINEIAKCVNLSNDKVQFLFHQMFKKLVQGTAKVKYSETLHFKKQNDLKISYLYTYENLIDYCLGQLPGADTEKVKLGLELYPMLMLTQQEYFKIINQIKNLKVQKTSNIFLNQSPIDLNVSNSVKADDSKNKKFLTTKKIIAVGIFSLIIIACALILPNIKNNIFYTQNKIIYTEPIIKNNVVPVDVEPIAASSVPKELAPEPVTVQPAEVASTDVGVAVPASATTPKPAPSVASQSVVSSGLYRGVLNVKNLTSANKKILDKLISLGGQKAGEVELGWIKSKNIAYYHFTISEANKKLFEDYLKQFAAFELKFVDHPRQVAAGSTRCIIEIKGNE